MEKIFKKSLALMVSAALCLTAFVGCLTVNAETAGSATVTVGEVTAKTTETTVKVPVTIAAGADATTGIAAAIFDITVDSAKFNFSKRNWAECLTYDTKQNIHVSTITNGDFIQPISGTNNTYRFLVEGLAEGSTDENTLGTFTSATFNLTFDVIDNTAGETAITFNKATMDPQACNAGTLDLQGKYTGDEKPFIVTTAAGKITVQAAGAEPEHIDYTIRTPVLRVQEKYGFRIRVDKAEPVTNYDHYEILLETQKYEGDNYTLTDVSKTFLSTERDESSTTERDYYFYEDVTAFALNVPIHLTVKFYDADNNYVAYSNTLDFAVSDLAKTGIEKTTTNSKLKTLYIDMLNYGTAAQVYFSKYGTNNGLLEAEAINSNCEDYQQYATVDTPTLNGVSNPNDISGAGFACTPGLQVSASNYIYYRFTVPASYDVENLTLSLTHTSLYGDQITNNYNLKDLSLDTKGRYILPYSAVALYDSSAVVTAVINDADSNAVYSLQYNIDFYVNSKLEDSNYKDLFVPLAKFSSSSYAYFKMLADGGE